MSIRRNRQLNLNKLLRIRGKLLVDVKLKGYNIKVSRDFINDVLDKTEINNIAVFNIANSGILVSIVDYVINFSTSIIGYRYGKSLFCRTKL